MAPVEVLVPQWKAPPPRRFSTHTTAAPICSRHSAFTRNDDESEGRLQNLPEAHERWEQNNSVRVNMATDTQNLQQLAQLQARECKTIGQYYVSWLI